MTEKEKILAAHLAACAARLTKTVQPNTGLSILDPRWMMPMTT